MLYHVTTYQIHTQTLVDELVESSKGKSSEGLRRRPDRTGQWLQTVWASGAARCARKSPARWTENGVRHPNRALSSYYVTKEDSRPNFSRAARAGKWLRVGLAAKNIMTRRS